MVIIACLVGYVLYNLLLNRIAQSVYPTRVSDPPGRRLMYRVVFSIFPLCLAGALMVLFKLA